MGIINFKKWMAISVLALGISLTAQAQNNYLMAAMGDSITAGFLASTDLSWYNGGRSTLEEIESIDAIMLQASRTSLSSLNADNISGTIAKVFENRKTLSWSTGKKIQSQYIFLKNYLNQTEPGSKLAAYNIALSGGKTQDLFSQADHIVSKMKSGKFKSLKYVTLLIGNNDACHGATVDQIKTNMHEVFRRLSLAQTSTINVMMSGIPRIPDLGQQPINSSKTIMGLSCSAMRNEVTHTCTSLVSWTNQTEYQNLITYIQAVNEALYESAQDANTSFPNLKVAFSNSLFDEPLNMSNLAVDCFHPNEDSQGRISQVLWQEQPFFH